MGRVEELLYPPAGIKPLGIAGLLDDLLHLSDESRGVCREIAVGKGHGGPRRDGLGGGTAELGSAITTGGSSRRTMPSGGVICQVGDVARHGWTRGPVRRLMPPFCQKTSRPTVEDFTDTATV